MCLCLHNRTMLLFMFYFLIMLLPLATLEENHQFCDRDSETCNSKTSEAEKYAKFNGKLLDVIEESNKNYTPCLAKNCSCFFETLKSDLRPYQEGITSKMLEKVRHKGTTYIVFANRLYRSKECIFPARCSGVEHFLLELLPKLPNVEFILNSRDWPQIMKHFNDSGPVFSFSKTQDYLDIHFPAWSFWEGGPAIRSYPKGLGRWDLMKGKLIKEGANWPWQKKLNIGFFRGSRTSEERDAFILLSRTRPDLIDAQYTKNQAWKSPADTLHAEPAQELPLEEHCKFKYLFNMRGVAASFRFKHLFLCGSLVLHVGDEWTEFFYGVLKPWIHYVPVATDVTQQDIISLLTFLKNHDDLARDIARRGQEVIQNHLRMKDVRCYWRNLLRRYSKLLKFPVTLDPSFEEIR